MEFDETSRFWYPNVALVTWINFAFSSNKKLRSDFHRCEKETKKEIKKIKSSQPLSLHLHALCSDLPFILYYYYYYYYYYFGYLIHIASFGSVSVSKFFISFQFTFILNELSPSHFLTSGIFVKISSLKSLTVYHPENRKLFRLSQNSTKLF